MPDFSISIEIGYFTDNWGPYSFNFPIASGLSENDGMIPYNSTIASVAVKAYQGNVSRKSTLADETEVTAMIDTDYAPVVNTAGDTVSIKLQYPNVSFKGQKATIIFELTLSTGAKKSFYAQYVQIR